MSRKLNERQKRAADFFIQSGSKTQALIKAGYSKKTAGSNATRFFGQPFIKEYVQHRLKLLEGKRIASAEEVMQRLTLVMRNEKGKAGDKAAKRLGKRYGICR